ncbi:UDP-3-O-(3-hydroxymyristoyl)glucosamine N-acyltransferase [Sulfurimonas marina]|uniref:UDP-3-O-acylglucosamine N-acyltransferase n=1 Tax=Sulfurimonas marina TaxID=2590551 RepID=A0A7M1AVD4_9BACT|nr:UDP-3-O-(3-hydroxymyristoyl)glucosamine N-acyltransferase [Sulfurimonas marina]QOP41346.1 UDP-3-O-(3-hydroxymyristoyl)glucosamine N-acyltransferase [Sulfurimonas marina]
MKLSEIAQIIGAEFSGADREISSMNTLKDATEEQLSFIANAKYVKDMAASKAAAIIVNEKTKEYVPEGCVALVVEDTYWQMAVLSKYFSAPVEDKDVLKAVIGEGCDISEKAEIANGAKIGNNCTIMAGVYVGSGSEIGDNTILYPNVVVYRDCKVGSDCIIHAGTVVGSDGFGFASNRLGQHKKIYHNGNVVIEDDVEIGSNVSIDRAVFGSTHIKKGARLDNLIQVAHNCVIGEGSVFAAQTGMAGSSIIGRNNVFGAQSGTAGHLHTGDFNTFAARSGVTKTITESGKTFAGFPLMDHKMWLKLQGTLSRLLKK